VGPTAIRSGRLAYNDAITETNNQQLLMNVIHNRYEERENLVPFSAGAVYEENPTISYTLVDGENYAKLRTIRYEAFTKILTGGL